MKIPISTGLVRAALAAAALAAAVPATPAQDVRTNPRFHPVDSPLQRITYDLGTHEVTRLGIHGGSGRRADWKEIPAVRAVANCFLNNGTAFYAVAPVVTQQSSAGCGSHAWALPVQKNLNLVVGTSE